MELPPRERTVLVSATHGPRTLHRLVTTVAGRGYAVEDLRYSRSADPCRALVVLVLDAHVASRGVEHLCAAIARAPEVLWARPLSTLAGEGPQSARFVLDRYEVSSRSTGLDRARTNAVVAALVDGRRHLGAGEGDEPVAALVEAFRSLVPVAVGAPMDLTVADRWSRSGPTGQALVSAVVAGQGLRRVVVRADDSELSAAAAALSGALSTAVDVIAPAERVTVPA